jgi:hypothetical protein
MKIGENLKCINRKYYGTYNMGKFHYDLVVGRLYCVTHIGTSIGGEAILINVKDLVTNVVYDNLSVECFIKDSSDFEIKAMMKKMGYEVLELQGKEVNDCGCNCYINLNGIIIHEKYCKYSRNWNDHYGLVIGDKVLYNTPGGPVIEGKVTHLYADNNCCQIQTKSAEIIDATCELCKIIFYD